MAQPFLSEIRIASFGILPRGWAYCNGQILSIAQNQALFSLVGTKYGGDGITTFALPDLRGRLPLGAGTQYTLGETSGQYEHTLLVSEMPSHQHSVLATMNAATSSSPQGQTFATADANVGDVYGPATSPTVMAEQMIMNTGNNLSHENTMPLLTLNFMIAIQGTFPTQS